MQNKQWKQWIGWGLLAAALVYSTVWIFCGGGNPKDPFYWMTKCELLESGWMACGTIALGHVWILLFGRTIFSMRLLGWLCTTIAVALPYLCLLSREQRRDNIHWLAITYWLVGYGSFQEFSPGSISVLLLSALLVTLFRKSDKYPFPVARYACAVALLIASLLLVRFPNILAVPVILIWMLLPIMRRKRPWTDLWQGRNRALLIGLVGGALLYGLGLIGWYYGMDHHISASVGQHTMDLMLQKMGENGYKLIAGMSLWGAFGFGLWLAGRPVNKAWQWFAAAATGGLMLYVVIYACHATQWYNMDQIYLISSIVLLCALVLVMQRGKHLLPLTVVLCSLMKMTVASLGTDTGFMKLFPALLCLLPWWAAYIQWPCRQRYVLTAMFIITALFVVRFSTNAIGRHNIFEEKTWGQTDIMHLTRISEEYNTQMLQREKDYAEYSPKAHVYAVGDAQHMMRALTHCHQPAHNEFWSNIFDPVYTKWYAEVVGREHPVIFCFFSPSFRTKPEYKDKHSAVEEMLRDSGYTAIDRSEFKYMIYYKE